MVDINTMVDSLGVFLTGGATNTNPDLSLGGAKSSTRVRGLGAIITNPIPAIRVDNVFPACGEGSATLFVDKDGKLVFIPPGTTKGGTPVAIAAGESKVVAGIDSNKAIRVFRESGLAMPIGASVTLKFVNAMNGVLGQNNVTNAQRAAGVTTYRAVMLTALSLTGVLELKLWLPGVEKLQSTYAIAKETAPGGVIQTIASETTAPTGLTWVSPRKEGDALTVSPLETHLGLWIRRVFPVGIVAPLENVQLATKYLGA